MATRWDDTDAPRGDDYDARWQRLAARGENVHGEADLVESLLGDTPLPTILDAGCGTGRVAIELDRRGHEVVGVDSDPGMLSVARRKGGGVRWVDADLADLGASVEERFGLVVLAGNVMIFLDPGTETQVVGQIAARVEPGGLVVAGFGVSASRLPLDTYDQLADRAGLELVDRWSTWDREPYVNGDYAVSVHRLRR
jgi:SAM-dependent methyltransferase